MLSYTPGSPFLYIIFKKSLFIDKTEKKKILEEN